MGWGPVDWVERVLPEAKLKNTTTLLFEIFRFERPIPRYLLKTVLPCKALGFSYGLISAVYIGLPQTLFPEILTIIEIIWLSSSCKSVPEKLLVSAPAPKLLKL